MPVLASGGEVGGEGQAGEPRLLRTKLRALFRPLGDQSRDERLAFTPTTKCDFYTLMTKWIS